MTAPDPVLTDLIAAHTSYVDDSQRYCKGCDWTSDPEIDRRTAETDHAAHVALVVEQHTNGRITELEAELEKQKRGGRTLGKAIDRTLKWVIEASNSEDLIGDDGDGDWEIVWDRLFQLRPDLDAANARAEKAEATVARVITALEAAEKSVPDDWGVTYIYTSQLRAALEGEQQ